MQLGLGLGKRKAKAQEVESQRVWGLMWRYGVLFRAPLGQKLRMELIYEMK